jgi:hypothetical protein
VEIRGDDGSLFEVTANRDKAGKLSGPVQISAEGDAVTELAEVSNPAPTMSEQEWAARYIRPDAAERIAEWRKKDEREQRELEQERVRRTFAPAFLAKLEAQEREREAGDAQSLQHQILRELADEGDADAAELLQSLASEGVAFEEAEPEALPAEQPLPPIPNFEFHFSRGKDGRINGPLEIRADDGNVFELEFSRDKDGRIASPYSVRRKESA